MTMTDVRSPAPSGPNYQQTSNSSAVRRPSPKLAASALENEVLATLGLLLFSVAVAAGYARVFAGWQFLDDFVVMAVVGHGAGFALRRLAVPAWAAIPATIALMAWIIGFVHYRDSYTLLLPTSDTFELFQTELRLVRQQFRSAVAPVLFGNGWDVIAAIGMGLVVVLSDAFAFRALARAESLVPGGVLFVFIAALGTDRLRVGLTVALIIAGVAATVALRAHHAPQRPASIGRRRSPSQLVVPAALGTALVVGLVAGYAGPRLPGAGEDPIYETRGGNGGSVTEVISPLVDIRKRLTNRSNSELFVVQAEFESYWRSSALPRFDGTTWGLPERALSRADGQLSSARDGSNELRQEIRIVNLGGKFVPTAADPVAASPQDQLRWNADSSTLLKTGDDLATGEVYQIVSASPRFDAAALANATSTDAGDPIYLELPDNFPGVVRETALSVTADASTPYETALKLQNWFRDEFDYSLEVQAGHSNTAIEGFLRDRVGYCEQFAGTYAAMMRTLGIPARVAVGFTPGTQNDDGDYSVLGKNAHAWPEVWFDDFGWVPFEPTPGRGAPGAENYTDVPQQQDGSGIDPDLPAPTPGDAGDESDALPSGIEPFEPTPTAPASSLPGAAGEGAESPTVASRSATESDGFAVPWRTLGGVAGVGVLLGLPAMLRRLRRRRSISGDPTIAIASYWRRALNAAGEIGIRPLASSTPVEQAALTAVEFPIAARPMQSLAHAITTAAYAPAGEVPVAPSDCAQWCHQIEAAVNESISPVARVRRYFTRFN